MLTNAQLICTAFGLMTGLLTGFTIAWYVVDRDYNQHLQRLVRGEADQPLRHILPKGIFQNFEA